MNVADMKVADRIGLLPPFSLLAGRSFWATLLLCWAITPGLMFVIGIIGESRIVPVTFHHQFLAFFPGDLLLGTGVALLLQAAKKLPAEQHWYQHWLFQAILCIATFGYATQMTVWEATQASGYAQRALYSPTKIYHNVALVWGYGYLAISTLVAVLARARTRMLVWALVPLVLWFGLMKAENYYMDQLHPGLRQEKAAHAHVGDWQPFWETGRIKLTI